MASAPGNFWFYLAGDQTVGPVTEEQLRAAISGGVVGPSTMVRHATWSNWYPAAQVSSLAPRPPGSPPQQASSIPPEVQELSPEFSIQLAQSGLSRRRANGKKGKKDPSSAIILVFLALLAACGGVAAGLWILQSTKQEPEKPVVARVPKNHEADRPRDLPAGLREKPEFTLPPFEAQMPAESGPAAGDSRAKFEIPEPPTPQGRIDELVFAKWKELGIEPANRCSDPAFLRRAYLDVIGTLPTVKEAREFLNDKSPDKRKKLIDALLQRNEFADYWAMKWSDLLRVKAEFPINLWPNAAQAYHRWIRHSIKTNLPYDQFVRAMLTSSGSNFRVGPVNFYRAVQSKDPKGIAQAVALTFMGTRADKWPAERLEGMSGFFTKIAYKPTGEWKEEIVIFDPLKTNAPKPAAAAKPGAKQPAEKKAKPVPPPKPVFPDGTSVEIAWNKDPREVFADWLISPENSSFTQPIVNRIWSWLLGRGIVHEADDWRPDNRPSNPELLAYLAEELVKSKYDLRHIYRLILNSSTYQLSAIPKSKHPEAGVYFASYAVRRLEAEVIIDALNQITGTTESYSSIIPEPYSFIPEVRRSIALPDGSITSSFLELFGRPPRDSGLESERNNRITAAQRLHLLNSSHIRNKLQNGPAIKKLREDGDLTENLYLAILSRFPGEGDARGGDALAWTLVNSTEFIFRH